MPVPEGRSCNAFPDVSAKALDDNRPGGPSNNLNLSGGDSWSLAQGLGSQNNSAPFKPPADSIGPNQDRPAAGSRFARARSHPGAASITLVQPQIRAIRPELGDPELLSQLRRNFSRFSSSGWQWALGLVVASFLAMPLSGCRATGAGLSVPVGDPALRALGSASIRVLAEKMESPLGESEKTGGRGGILTRTFFLEGRYEGRVSEALLAVSAAVGYGLTVENQQSGDLVVAIEPKTEPATVMSLIKELNRTLKPSGAYIGVDVINRRLVLKSGGHQ